MKYLKFILFGLVATSISAQAAGAASLVGKKSKTKDYNYSWDTREYFVEDCSQNANKWICKCVLEKLQHEYSEAEFLYINKDLYNNIDHPEFVDFVSTAVDLCDSEYTNSRRNDSYGTGDGLAGLLGGGGGGIATKAKGSIRTPSERDIDISDGAEIRSAADIMKVVRQRTPGLRHVYNKFLKKKPGFQGKVSLKFTIASGGEIISISVANSTTGYSAFDDEVKADVSRWKFNKVKSGNTTVTIPFTFSE
ncbi:AgmX/PglI C-terminal domain-containing protein [Fibrobacter sp. UWB10]|uniref:AgmX/PglI C-terminal domain-containing protein n=1 Tax=Fibrobacter sp. UWB10 TaxID=1896201 RepID=UPI002402E823|nr:AgmX/PglI C-terminal domain-containing protein [Fibrobacter sp. UWB10]SMP53656.1 TonB family C-terminal domain-containing protein [Fibrobacter sp. UWB10]